jgi:hypothetical protein
VELLQDLLFESDADFPDFFETGRKHNGSLNASFDAVFNQPWHCGGWGGDDGQVNLLRHFLNGGVSPNAEHISPFQVDGKNRSPKGIAD